MGKALEKLLARTSGEKKKKPRTRIKTVKDAKLTRMKNIARLEKAAGEDVRDLKLLILEKLKDKPTYQKKQRVQHSEFMMPPGLAPIGYDPDESDEEDPY